MEQRPGNAKHVNGDDNAMLTGMPSSRGSKAIEAALSPPRELAHTNDAIASTLG